MKLKLYPLIWIIILSLLSACQQDEMQDKDTLYRTLSDHVLATCIHNPEASFSYIDSLENNHVITIEIADYFRANTHYALNHMRAVEYYNKKALNGNALYNEWRRGYYVASRNLANNLNWKGDFEGSLNYATKAYENSIHDTSFVAKLNAPGLLLQIALCQKSLGNKYESEKHFEQGYQQSRELAMEDTTFNTHYYYAQNTLAVMTRMDANTPEEQAMLWIQRTEDAIAKLNKVSQMHPLGDVDKSLLETTTAQADVSKARVLMLLKQTKEADKAYEKFMKSRYSRSIGGIFSQYNYMRAAKRWDKAAALIPLVDSARVLRGEYYSLDFLHYINLQRQTLENAGMHQQAQEKANFLMESIDSVISVQQKSTANELAVIFETAQKERTIAEQDTKIARLWILMVITILLIVVIFFIFFTLHRQKNIKKMEKGHLELQKAYDQLTIANERAEESSKMKTAFIRHISHEIRTPLNILSGFTQIITDEAYHLDEDVRKEANLQIIENTNRITEVVSKMLELSEASSRSVIERTDRLDIHTIVNKAISLSNIDLQPNISLTIDIAEDVDKIVLPTDERRIIRALSFLLGNAWKFTKKGDVRLIVQRSEDNHNICFIVEDSGIGIPAEEAEHIFEEFVQLDDYSEGAGIGLTVTRSYARQLGGDCVLDTNYKGGARFILKHPIEV